jgi:PilZ domain
MQSSSGLPASRATEAPSPRHRLHYRHPIQSGVYVTLDEGNGGIIRNLSQDGAAIQAVGALRPGQQLRMRFDLLNPRTRVDVRAQVSWANPAGQAGLRFMDLSPQSSRHVNDWIFFNLLRGLERASPVLSGSGERDELILSTTARPAIPMPEFAADEVVVNSSDKVLSLPWWPRPMTSQSFARLMDGLVLLSAVLMFFCMFLAVAHTLPAWPVAMALAAGVSGFFTALYWYLCSWMGSGTAGVQLARIAMRDTDAEKTLREEESRFR